MPAKGKSKALAKPHREELAEEWRRKGKPFSEDPEAEADANARAHEEQRERGIDPYTGKKVKK